MAVVDPILTPGCSLNDLSIFNLRFVNRNDPEMKVQRWGWETSLYFLIKILKHQVYTAEFPLFPGDVQRHSPLAR